MFLGPLWLLTTGSAHGEQQDRSQKLKHQYVAGIVWRSMVVISGFIDYKHNPGRRPL